MPRHVLFRKSFPTYGAGREVVLVPGEIFNTPITLRASLKATITGANVGFYTHMTIVASLKAALPVKRLVTDLAFIFVFSYCVLSTF